LENFKLSRFDHRQPNINQRRLQDLPSDTKGQKPVEIPYKKITSLKYTNKKLKVLLSVGGLGFLIIFFNIVML